MTTSEDMLDQELARHREEKKGKSKYVINGWHALYHLTYEYDTEDGGREKQPSGFDQNTWSIHETELELRRVQRRDGMNIYIPTSVMTIVTKYPHPEGYGSEINDSIVYEKTTGRYMKGQLSNYEFLLDNFFTSLPFKEPDDNNTFPITGQQKVTELFYAGLNNGVLPQPGMLFDQVMESKIFSYSISHFEDNPNKTLYFKALVPVRDSLAGDLTDSGYLFPTSIEREYHKELREVKDLLQKLKNEENKTTKTAVSSLLFEKTKMDDEELKKMLEDMR